MNIKQTLYTSYKSLAGTLNIELGMWISLLIFFSGQERSADMQTIFVLLCCMHPVLACSRIYEGYMMTNQSLRMRSVFMTIISVTFRIIVIAIIFNLLLNKDWSFDLLNEADQSMAIWCVLEVVTMFSCLASSIVYLLMKFSVGEAFDIRNSHQNFDNDDLFDTDIQKDFLMGITTPFLATVISSILLEKYQWIDDESQAFLTKFIILQSIQVVCAFATTYIRIRNLSKTWRVVIGYTLIFFLMFQQAGVAIGETVLTVQYCVQYQDGELSPWFLSLTLSIWILMIMFLQQLFMPLLAAYILEIHREELEQYDEEFRDVQNDE